MPVANEHEVVQIGRSTLYPMPDVMRVEEPLRFTTGEGATSVAVAQLSLQPTRNCSRSARPIPTACPAPSRNTVWRRASQASRNAVSAEITGPLTILHPLVAATQCVELGLHHDRGAICILVFGDGPGAQRIESIGASGVEGVLEALGFVIFVLHDVGESPGQSDREPWPRQPPDLPGNTPCRASTFWSSVHQ